MKAAANGVLNCRVLDGWWDEGYGPRSAGPSAAARSTTTWTTRTRSRPSALRPAREGDRPAFYDRGRDGCRAAGSADEGAMRCLCPVFNTNRMVRDYAREFYLPASRPRRLGGGQARARALAAWKAVAASGPGGASERAGGHGQGAGSRRQRRSAPSAAGLNEAGGGRAALLGSADAGGVILTGGASAWRPSREDGAKAT